MRNIVNLLDFIILFKLSQTKAAFSMTNINKQYSGLLGIIEKIVGHANGLTFLNQKDEGKRTDLQSFLVVLLHGIIGKIRQSDDASVVFDF